MINNTIHTVIDNQDTVNSLYNDLLYTDRCPIMTTCALPLSITIKISCLYRPVLVFLYTRVRPTGQLINKLPYTIKYICETLFTVTGSTIDNNFYMGKIFSRIFSNILHNETNKKSANGCAKKEIVREKKGHAFSLK